LEAVGSSTLPHKCKGKVARVWFPQSLTEEQVLAYQISKPSAYLSQTLEQRQKIAKAMNQFSDPYGCGLELVALRRSHGGRQQGSNQDIATAISNYSRTGGDHWTKALNLTRAFEALAAVRLTHLAKMHDRKAELRKQLDEAINASNLAPATALPGLLVKEGHVILSE